MPATTAAIIQSVPRIAEFQRARAHESTMSSPLRTMNVAPKTTAPATTGAIA